MLTFRNVNNTPYALRAHVFIITPVKRYVYAACIHINLCNVIMHVSFFL